MADAKARSLLAQSHKDTKGLRPWGEIVIGDPAHAVMNLLASMYIRVMSWLSYLY